MTGFVLVLLFSAAGLLAALLAVRAAPKARAIRWLAIAFIAVLVTNLGLYLWPVIAADPAGMGWKLAIAAVVALAVLAYMRLLRAIRRAARQREDR